MPVFSASARADRPVFELAAIAAGAINPFPVSFRTSMLPIEPVPINPYRVMFSHNNFGRMGKKIIGQGAGGPGCNVR
jgi:hypothetical protein